MFFIIFNLFLLLDPSLPTQLTLCPHCLILMEYYLCCPNIHWFVATDGLLKIDFFIFF